MTAVTVCSDFEAQEEEICHYFDLSPSICHAVMGLDNNRMGKTRDLLKKIRDTKGTFHAKIDSIKDINGMDLTEAEDI